MSSDKELEVLSFRNVLLPEYLERVDIAAPDNMEEAVRATVGSLTSDFAMPDAVPHDLVVPPPRPKRKPAKPYPRKADSAALLDDSGGPPPPSPAGGGDSLRQCSGSPALQRPLQRTSSLSPLSVAPISPSPTYAPAIGHPGQVRGRGPPAHSSQCRLDQLSSVALDGAFAPCSSTSGAEGMSFGAPSARGRMRCHAPGPARLQSNRQPLLEHFLPGERVSHPLCPQQSQQLQQLQQLEPSQQQPQQQTLHPLLPMQLLHPPITSQQLATVAAVAAAASAAAAAAASAVVASADSVTQAMLDANPPKGFPFFGIPPSSLAHLAALAPPPAAPLRTDSTLPHLPQGGFSHGTAADPVCDPPGLQSRAVPSREQLQGDRPQPASTLRAPEDGAIAAKLTDTGSSRTTFSSLFSFIAYRSLFSSPCCTISYLSRELQLARVPGWCVLLQSGRHTVLLIRDLHGRVGNPASICWH